MSGTGPHSVWGLSVPLQFAFSGEVTSRGGRSCRDAGGAGWVRGKGSRRSRPAAGTGILARRRLMVPEELEPRCAPSDTLVGLFAVVESLQAPGAGQAFWPSDVGQASCLSDETSEASKTPEISSFVDRYISGGSDWLPQSVGRLSKSSESDEYSRAVGRLFKSSDSDESSPAPDSTAIAEQATDCVFGYRSRSALPVDGFWTRGRFQPGVRDCVA